MYSSVNIFSNTNEKSITTKDIISSKLESNGIKISNDHTGDFNLVIGGDGAFLRAVRDSNFSDKPFVGINTGHLGFYQEILIDEIDDFIEKIKSNNFFISRLSLVSCESFSKGSSKLDALNEFVVRSTNGSIVHLDVFIDDYFLETFAGDGLIISTSSGSTAYNFSAGGSVLYQELKGFQLTPLAPINSKAYRSLPHSIVMPEKTKLKIITKSPVLLTQDGIDLQYNNIEGFEFTISDKRINKLVFDPKWYWINIKDKFL